MTKTVKKTETKIRQFDGTTMPEIKGALKRSMDNLGARLGVRLKVGKIRYGKDRAELYVDMRPVDEARAA